MNSNYQSAIDCLFQEAGLGETPYIRALKDGKLTVEQFRGGALQGYHVVRFFPRFIAALIANIDDHMERLDLIGNLLEEHGGLHEERFHVTTYKEFLYGLGISREEIEQSRPIPGVQAYNRALYDLCAHRPYLEGVAAMGVVEQVVAMVSPLVSTAALSTGLLSKERLRHFDGHAVIDVDHAQETYRIADRYFDDPELREQILTGLSLGMYYHLRLYEDMFNFVCASRSAS
jgi:pyrroloquinoline-quinone synthase